MVIMMVDCDHDDRKSLFGIGMKRSFNRVASEQDQIDAMTSARRCRGDEYAQQSYSCGEQVHECSSLESMEVDDAPGVCRYCQRQFSSVCQARTHEAQHCVQNKNRYPTIYAGGEHADNKFVADKENICFRCGRHHHENSRYCYPTNSVDAYFFR